MPTILIHLVQLRIILDAGHFQHLARAGCKRQLAALQHPRTGAGDHRLHRLGEIVQPQAQHFKAFGGLALRNRQERKEYVFTADMVVPELTGAAGSGVERINGMFGKYKTHNLTQSLIVPLRTAMNAL